MARPRAETREIRRHLQRLKQQPWLLRHQQWWPDYLFHCTDVRNVASILRSGEMLSRKKVLESRQPHVDIASSEIIAQTDEFWHDYVRLYFRPRTPTQFQNEGFRPPENRPYGVQCPVPVYLLLDAIDVLSGTGVLFTDGNVAAGPTPTDDIGFFKSIPFETVYHDGAFGRDNRGTIVYHRNAEVLVPERLSTNAIRGILCRSQAEYETLLDLLSPGVLHQWVDRIRVRPGLFFRRWCFLEQVEMTPEYVRFRFHVGNPAGPFDARAEIVPIPTGQTLNWSKPDFKFVSTLNLRLRSGNLRDYTCRLFLDDQLAYSGKFQDEPLPF